MKRMVHDGTRCSYKDAFSLCVRGECKVSAVRPVGGRGTHIAQGISSVGLSGVLTEAKHAKFQNQHLEPGASGR